MFRKTNFYLTHPCPHLFWLDSGMVNAVAFHPPVFTFFSFVTKTLINIVTPQVSLREGYKNPSFGIRLLGRKGRNCSKKMRNKVKGKIAKKLTERGGPLNGLILLTQCNVPIHSPHLPVAELKDIVLVDGPQAFHNLKQRYCSKNFTDHFNKSF